MLTACIIAVNYYSIVRNDADITGAVARKASTFTYDAMLARC